MSLFTPPSDDVLTSVSSTAGRERGLVKVARGGGSDSLAVISDKGTVPDLSKQFVLFQLNPAADGPAVLEASKVQPQIDGSAAEPDVLVALQLLSLHLAASENIEPNTRATLRINFGKDESSTDRRFETAFWSIAAGLNLYNEFTQKRANNKDFKSDLHKAFGNRPIEIPGGLGRLSFEIVQHTEPPWWRRIFRFLQTETGTSLVSVLGFPAVTSTAIDALDSLLGRLTEADAKPLFKSLPMRLALSKYARDEFTGGSSRVSIGGLSRGFCVMARGCDFDLLRDSKVTYLSTYDKLVPQDATEADILAGRVDDSLDDVTYAIFRVGTKSTKLDPTFNYA